MKKLLFFKSSSSNGGEDHELSRTTRDKKRYVETRWKTVISENLEKKLQSPERFSPVSDGRSSERNTMSRKTVVLRKSRSLSMSPGARENGRLQKEDMSDLRIRKRFPSSTKGASARLCDCSDCNFQPIHRDPRPDKCDPPTIQIPSDEVLFDRACSVPSYASSPQSSSGSASIPGQVLDLYVDGEHHHQEMKLGCSIKNASLLKGRSHSSSNLFAPSQDFSRDPLASKSIHESPRTLAKGVVERLVRLEHFCDPKPTCKRFDGLGGCFENGSIGEEDNLGSKKQSPFRRSELQSEERRLRDRIRELAEKNACYQNEVSSFYTKEKEYNTSLSLMEADLKDTVVKMEQVRSDNEGLQKELSDIQEKLRVAEDIGSCMERNYKEKEKENAGLIKLVARLQGTCSQQERTIDGLRQSLNLETENQQKTSRNLTVSLQMQLSRLSEVEQDLRRQLEACRVETESLRHENIYLFERLKSVGKAESPSSFKLDQELESYVQCIKNTGLSLLNETTQMCSKLFDVVKSKTAHDGLLEAHSLVEYDVKIQGFKQGARELERSLGKAASVLKEKNEPGCHDSESDSSDLKSELKAEKLLTSILKEKLCSKEKEVEQLEAELARALRNHDVLKTEVQDAFDTISCVNHKMRNLELQMIKKDGMINQLEGEVRAKGEELSSTKGVLSKVSQERDMMWEEVKQHSEKNMLLNCELNSLKKKIEALEEDTLLKDGQISILKDSLNNAQPFADLPFGLDHRETFRL